MTIFLYTLPIVINLILILFRYLFDIALSSPVTLVVVLFNSIILPVYLLILTRITAKTKALIKKRYLLCFGLCIVNEILCCIYMGGPETIQRVFDNNIISFLSNAGSFCSIIVFSVGLLIARVIKPVNNNDKIAE